jgi:hypothetical protein
MTMPKVDVGKPKQLLCKAGDVVIANYSMAHTVACHGGMPQIRVGLFLFGCLTVF